MNKIQETLNDAYRMLSIIQVSGEAVDVMAAVRSKIKAAYKLADDNKEEEDG